MAGGFVAAVTATAAAVEPSQPTVELVAEEGVDPADDDGRLATPDGVAFDGVEDFVVLPGACGANAPLEPGWSVDCRFVLRPGAAERIEFASLTDRDGSFTRCAIERSGRAEILRCPDLLGERYEQGTVSFTLQIDELSSEGAASLTTQWRDEPRFSVFAGQPGESVVFDGRPLRWFSYFYEEVDGVFLTIRNRDGGPILDTVSVPIEEPFISDQGTADLDLPLGRYRMWPCVGPTVETCVELPGGRPFQIISGEPLELIEGHNRPTAARINVLFVGSGLHRIGLDTGGPGIGLADLARRLMTVGGPVGLDFDGGVVPDDAPADQLMWGPMAIEPLRSNLDRFNFWYLEDDVADETGLLFGGLDETGDAGFDLPNLQITALYSSDQRFASDARGTSFETSEPNPVGPRGRIRFGDARVWVPTYDPLGVSRTLAHEWGHGLFGLRDEYYGFDDRGIAVGYPNCAPDAATAERWWGSMVGEIDPFVDEVASLEAERLRDPGAAIGASGSGSLRERTVIEITEGGCYSDVGSAEVYRPSQDSLMNSEVPVFGAVNRARVEEVLAQFSGRGPMGSLDDLTLRCEGFRGRINCSGTLRSHLDRPLSIVAIDSMPCEFGPGELTADGSVAPVRVTCSTVGPAEPVDLTFKTEQRTVDVVDLNPPPEPTRDVSRLEVASGDRTDPVVGESDDDNGQAVAVGGLLIVATVALGFVERRRRANAGRGSAQQGSGRQGSGQ